MGSASHHAPRYFALPVLWISGLLLTAFLTTLYGERMIAEQQNEASRYAQTLMEYGDFRIGELNEVAQMLALMSGRASAGGKDEVIRRFSKGQVRINPVIESIAYASVSNAADSEWQVTVLAAGGQTNPQLSGISTIVKAALSTYPPADSGLGQCGAGQDSMLCFVAAIPVADRAGNEQSDVRGFIVIGTSMRALLTGIHADADKRFALRLYRGGVEEAAATPVLAYLPGTATPARQWSGRVRQTYPFEVGGQHYLWVYEQALEWPAIHIILLIGSLSSGLLLTLFAHLWIRRSYTITRLLEKSHEEISQQVRQQTEKIRETDTELQRQKQQLIESSTLLDMLRKAILDFVQHADLDQTAHFMLDCLMDISRSDCGFIAEVTEGGDNSSTHFKRLALCHREGKDEHTNEIQDDSLVMETIACGEPLIRNGEASTPDRACMASCCASVSNLLVVPVCHGDEVVGVYGLADRYGGYNDTLLQFLEPFNATYAVLIKSMRGKQEQARTQRQLVEAREQAEQANSAKSEFLSRMSHELRSPLNAILGYSQLLLIEEQVRQQPDIVESLETIQHAGDHLLELINEVLDLSHIESGRVDIKTENLELASVIQESLDLVAVQAKNSNIRLIVHDLTFERERVKADRIRLIQVFVNLLSNAIKYNRKNGSVSVYGESSRDGTFGIFIRDTGEGITEDRQDRLFVPFDRLGAEHTDIEGTGIGLSITRKLVCHMGGSLELENSTTQGTTFRVSLPVTADENRVCLSPAMDNGAVTRHLREGSHKVLYIEDKPANASLIRSILARFPAIELLLAGDGGSGLRLAEEQNPDVIMVDINLPDISGYEVLARLRANHATLYTPVIAVTARAMPADIDKGRNCGFDRYLTKPVDINLFIHMLNEMLCRRLRRLHGGACTCDASSSLPPDC